MHGNLSIATPRVAPAATQIVIRAIAPGDMDWIVNEYTRRFGSAEIDSRGSLIDARELPGFVAVREGAILGALSHSPMQRGEECELVALACATERCGAGTRLLTAFVEGAIAAGVGRLMLNTSNDNTPALRFYQKRGWRLVRIDIGAITRARLCKPTIPLIGCDGITIADEIELEYPLPDKETK